MTPDRFYLAAESFGWGVRDRTLGVHPMFHRVAFFSTRDHGSWIAAWDAAAVERDRLNAGAVAS